MKFKLTCEDDAMVNPEDAGTETDAVEEQEATEAVEEASEDVEEVAEMGFNIVDVIENLTSLQAHVKKFGVTKQMLHLVNANNQLGDAIGLALPYYEDDDQVDDISEDDIQLKKLLWKVLAML